MNAAARPPVAEGAPAARPLGEPTGLVPGVLGERGGIYRRDSLNKSLYRMRRYRMRSDPGASGILIDSPAMSSRPVLGSVIP